jgi:hypothetical protein
MRKQPPLKSKYLKFTQFEFNKKEAEELISDLKRFLMLTEKAIKKQNER